MLNEPIAVPMGMLTRYRNGLSEHMLVCYGRICKCRKLFKKNSYRFNVRVYLKLALYTKFHAAKINDNNFIED